MENHFSSFNIPIMVYLFLCSVTIVTIYEVDVFHNTIAGIVGSGAVEVAAATVLLLVRHVAVAT